ncbi:MAG: Holliday junction branch migration DNA helicase RuvB [Deferribacteraceae bacterium]|jgi:Holliday junction DNA helicase RuvB|nr:Holliday junction branch migration DNA helicase RuvB [Deferribacteraceae bacterium]
MDTEELLSAYDDPPEDGAALRPLAFDEYTGQKNLIENLKVYVLAANKRRDSLDHTLFYGPPGLGKTTLANIIARELGVNIHVTSGPAIELGALAAILTNLDERDVLFIDEIHRINKVVEEKLYPAMEDFKLDLIIGQGGGARTIEYPLKKFTLVGATTRQGLLGKPLLDRFGIVERLYYYTFEELACIITRAAKLKKIPIEDAAALAIAGVSRGTPRIALRFLNRTRDFAEEGGGGVITLQTAEYALKRLGVDETGLDASDRRYLNALIEKYRGGPAGLETLSAVLSEEPDTIENVIEPYLIQNGYIEKTPRGRVAAPLAYTLLGKKPPIASEQPTIEDF